MYTSDTDILRRRGLRYLAAAAIVAAAGGVYEYFSHGVWSNCMVFAFAVPLTAGAAPNLLLAVSGDKKRPGRAGSGAAGLQLAAVATLTAGSFMQGVLEIYGTTNRLMTAYPVLGLALLAAALMAFAFRGRSFSGEPSERGPR